jgi:hypothetical protein
VTLCRCQGCGHEHDAPTYGTAPVDVVLIRLREACRQRWLPVEAGDLVYRDVAAVLTHRSVGTLANAEWQRRLPVRMRGRRGGAMYSLRDIAVALVELEREEREERAKREAA